MPKPNIDVPMPTASPVCARVRLSASQKAASAANKRPSTLSARYAFVFPRIFTSVALLIDKNIFDLHAEIPRNLKGQQDRRVVAAVFKRADRLP